jgi:hypothetical protein
MTDTHNKPCEKQMTIYHIKGHKVGSSCDLQRRLKSNQRRVLKSQNLEETSIEVLHTIKPNTLTYREVWELEQECARERGYNVESENHYLLFLRSHTNNHNKLRGAQVSSTRVYNLRKSDGSLYVKVDDPVGFALKHNFTKSALRNAACVKHSRRYLKIGGEKYTVEYADTAPE